MKIWYVTFNDLKIAFKDRLGLGFRFLTPLVIIALTSFVLSGAYNKNSTRITIPLVVKDEGKVARELVSKLRESDALEILTNVKKNNHWQPIDETEARQMVAKYKAAIIIPVDFSQKIKKGQKTEIIILSDPADRVVPSIARDIATTVSSRTGTIITSVKVASEAVKTVAAKAQNPAIGQEVAAAIRESVQLAEQMIDDPPIAIVEKKVQEGSIRKTTPFEQNVPGYTVMFVLLGTTLAAGALLEEKEQGTLNRLSIMPVGRWTILGGKMLSHFFLSLSQMVFLFLVGHILFGMWLGLDLLALFLMLAGTAFAVTGLGILLAAVSRTRSQAIGIGNMLMIVSSALGGSWWPLYMAPEWMQKVAHLTITAWAMDGFNALLIYGKTFSAILLPLLVLIAMGSGFFAIALYKFRLTD